MMFTDNLKESASISTFVLIAVVIIGFFFPPNKGTSQTLDTTTYTTPLNTVAKDIIVISNNKPITLDSLKNRFLKDAIIVAISKKKEDSTLAFSILDRKQQLDSVANVLLLESNILTAKNKAAIKRINNAYTRY